jgi:hypothetical protein
MSSPQTITFSLDRRSLEHPRAYHLRRMRAGLWLYVDLLARLPAGARSIEVEPAAIGQDMGLQEDTIRSWLGHLRKSGYLDTVRLNGKVRVTMRRVEAQKSAPAVIPTSTRFFTVAKIQRALGETSDETTLQAVLNLHSDDQIKQALAGTLAVPETQIRRSRTALFIYLLKRHAQAN